MTDPSSYDTKRYPLCSPYSGEIGPPFTRVFKPAFISAISASSDKFANYMALTSEGWILAAYCLQPLPN